VVFSTEARLTQQEGKALKEKEFGKTLNRDSDFVAGKREDMVTILQRMERKE